MKRAEFLARNFSEIKKRSQPLIGARVDLGEACLDKNAVLAAQRHDVGNRPDRRKVEDLLAFALA